MITAFIGMGSNLSSPLLQLQQAVDAMAALQGVSLQAVSHCYQSLPMGPSDQPDYVNAVAQLNVNLSCRDLLKALQKIELDQGRARNNQRWGPRTLDLDILLYGDHIIDQPDLVVPHYGMKEREFVIWPLADIASELRLPCGTSLQSLLAAVPANSIKRLPAIFDVPH